MPPRPRSNKGPRRGPDGQPPRGFKGPPRFGPRSGGGPRGGVRSHEPDFRKADGGDFRARHPATHPGLGPRRRGKPPLVLQPTTLWDYPSQHYGDGVQGNPRYKGATPSYIIWNLLQRYTEPGDLVVDPCAGSGTTLDVTRDLDRRALGYDLSPTRPDIFRADARALPLEDGKADFVFIDPPYSTHIDYSDDPRCIGKLSAADGSYYEAMEQVIDEIDRILRPERAMALYVSDSFIKGRGFFPIGFELFAMLRRRFTPVDIIAVTRHNRTLEMGNYRAAAEQGNFFLRGFNYLFIMGKESGGRRPQIGDPDSATQSDGPPPRDDSRTRDTNAISPRSEEGPPPRPRRKPLGAPKPPLPAWKRGPNRRPRRKDR